MSLIPREVLFGNPSRVAPKISPDGTLTSYLAPVDGVLNVWVGATGSDDHRPVTDDRDRGVRAYYWGWDNRTILYVQDQGGDENWHLYATDIQSLTTRALTPFDGVQARLVAHRRQFPDDVILALNRDDPAHHDAYHLDLRTGELTLRAKNPGNVAQWIVDADLRIRGASAATADGGFELLVREDEGADWRSVVTWSGDDSLASHPVGFTLDGKGMYIADSRDRQAAALARLSLSDGSIDVLAEDPRYDVAGAIIHPDTRVVQAVAFQRARTEWQVLDESVADDLHAAMAVESGDFHFIDRTAADDTWLLAFQQDAGPVSYYSFDRASRRSTFLFNHRPELADAGLVPMEPVSFTARDGLTIHGYLTRPSGETEGPLPMVLNVHGGPWHRDVWGYNPEAQWLANRGYACLQVNYRGSTGYGKAFLNAGDREWGGRMHDDLVDGVRWAIDEGIADPERVAIYGGSYGGYAALVGATFTPELFCCAVDIVGPSNLITFLQTVPAYWEAFLQIMYRRVGHPERDADFLRERSPLFRVDRIAIPLLIAQGANDPRVKQSESEQIVAAMKEKGIEHEYLVFPDEGHGFAKPENRLKFYAAAEEFLARYLGGRVEPRQA
ncbi:MAG: S9 family peptidase [Gemmatimonadota bacterium]|jgi:dipeptidyl aminopeptidase/acylaminoacyl peptidase